MNPFLIKGVEVRLLSMELRAPFITALGRKDGTENACLRLRLAGGAEGWGEASSSVVWSHWTPKRLSRSLSILARGCVGRDVRRWRRLSERAWKDCREAPAAAAFECALLDALTRALGIAPAEWFGGARRAIDTGLTLSAWNAGETRRRAAQAVHDGFKTLKVKVTGRAGDFSRVQAAAEAGAGSLILDGNQGFSSGSALRFAERCLRAGLPIALFEQPLPREDLKGMARLTKDSPIPIAADESVRSPEEALKMLDADAADAINVKLAKTGLARSLEIIALARAAKKRLMIGCMQESARGLSMSVHLACGTGAFRWADLDSDCLLGDDQPRGDYLRQGPSVTWTFPSGRRPRPRG